MHEMERELEEKKEEMNKYVNREHEKEESKIEKRDVKINTVIDFSNVPFTTIAEKLFEAKLQKKTRKIYTIMQKVEHNLSNHKPMKTELLTDFMAQAY